PGAGSVPVAPRRRSAGSSASGGIGACNLAPTMAPQAGQQPTVRDWILLLICKNFVRSSRLGLTCADGRRLGGCPQVKRALPTLSGDFCSGSAGQSACLAFPAWVRVVGGGADGLKTGET